MNEWVLDTWREMALCRETDPEIFFPEKGGSPQDAKGVCSRCDVTAECLEWALRTRQPAGIFGGLTINERRPLWGPRPPRERERCQKGLHNMREPRNVRNGRCRACDLERRNWRDAS
ncbi:MAG: WhiB family transcriptional regulator [Haloechinothrix sp.]